MIPFWRLFYNGMRSQDMGQTKSVLIWIYCIISVFLISQTSASSNRCSFPSEWRGRWFQNGYGEFEIEKHKATKFGVCSEHEGNKYLLFNKERRCFTCLVFTSQHTNLLQYKKSYCGAKNDLQQACDQITSDFTLHTIVKVSGSPIPCPFQGPYTFSYTNGSEVKCEEPISTINTCADDSRFLFHHKRCPRVMNTYDKTLSFQCIATWDNGVDSYLYGRFTGPLLTTKENQYRCFIYSLFGSYGFMSMTADATCLGLQSPELGMNVYKVQRRHSPQPNCQYPEFFSIHKEWRDVNGRLKYDISNKEDKFTIREISESGYLDEEEVEHVDAQMRVLCLGELDSVENGQRKKVELVSYVTDDSCTSNYHCVRLMQRTEGIVEVQIGHSSERPIRECDESNFRGTKKNFLLPSSKTGELQTVPCPMKGMYSFRDKNSNCNGKLDVGCSQENEMVVDSRCGDKQAADVLLCYASWTEFDHIYVIAGRSGDPRRAADCLVYSSKGNGFELKADKDCGQHRLKIRGSPIDFALSSASKSCKAPPARPTEIIRHEEKARPPKDQKRIYDTKANEKFNSADVIETPHNGGQTNSEEINSSERTSGKFIPVLISVFVVFLFQR